MSEKGIEELFQIIGSYNRFRMIQILCEGQLSMDELSKELNISVPAVLKHLDALERLKIVSSKSLKEIGEGRPKNVYYLAQKVIQKIILDDEIQAVEFYRVNPKVEKEDINIRDLTMKKTMYEVKLKKLERKRFKIIKELERLDRLEKEITG